MDVSNQIVENGLEIKCIKGFFIPEMLGVMQGEIWQEIEWEDGDAIFECKVGLNSGMVLTFTEEQLVNYFKVIS